MDYLEAAKSFLLAQTAKKKTKQEKGRELSEVSELSPPLGPDWPADLALSSQPFLERWEERAAIREHDGGYDRAAAERAAYGDVMGALERSDLTEEWVLATFDAEPVDEDLFDILDGVSPVAT